MSKKNCLVLGSATLDTIAYLKQEKEIQGEQTGPYIGWKKGSKLEVNTFLQSVGGGALNGALCLNKLDHNAIAYCVLGDDDAGKKIALFAQETNINLYPLLSTLATGSSFIVPTDNDRIIFTHYGANTALTPKTCETISYKQTEALYIAPLHGMSISSASCIIQKAHDFYEKNKITIALNPSKEHIENATIFKSILSSIDILIVNSEELLSCIGTLKSRFFISSGKGIIKNGPPLVRMLLAYQKATCTLYEIGKEILSYGVKRIVITDGARGAYVITKDILYFHPALPITVGTVLGAGDVFGSTFFSLLLHGMSIENALRGATINAASLIHQHIPHKGLLSLKELEKKIKTIDQAFLQIYPFCSF